MFFFLDGIREQGAFSDTKESINDAFTHEIMG